MTQTAEQPQTPNKATHISLYEIAQSRKLKTKTIRESGSTIIITGEQQVETLLKEYFLYKAQDAMKHAAANGQDFLTPLKKFQDSLTLPTINIGGPAFSKAINREDYMAFCEWEKTRAQALPQR